MTQMYELLPYYNPRLGIIRYFARGSDTVRRAIEDGWQPIVTRAIPEPETNEDDTEELKLTGMEDEY